MGEYRKSGGPELCAEARALLDARNYAVLATYGPGGRVHQSVLWVVRENDDLLFSTVEGRVKHKNLLQDDRASAIVYDLADPEKYVAVQGSVSILVDPDRTFSNSISQKYTGEDHLESDPTNVRVVLRLRPERVTYRRG